MYSMKMILKTVTLNIEIKVFDSISVECVCSFWKCNKHFQYLSADVGNVHLLLK
jgi:hypothetical protein